MKKEELSVEVLEDLNSSFYIKNYTIKIMNKYINRVTFLFHYLETHLMCDENEYEYPIEFMFNKELDKKQFLIAINEEITHIEFSSSYSLLEAIEVLIKLFNLKDKENSKIHMKSYYIEKIKTS